MKKLQKYRVSISPKGVEKKEKSGHPKMIIDSVADDFIIEGEQIIKSKTEKLRYFDVWEEVKSNKKTKPFNVKTAKGDDIKAFAKENEIDSKK